MEDYEFVASTEEVSVVLKTKIPPKLKDEGIFTVPCTKGNVSFKKCLCDLGININLILLSIFKKLCLSDPTSTNISMWLADCSITIR